MSTITYYTADELRGSLDDEAARTAFITEAGDQLVGGFYHGLKGDEWFVRRAEAPGVYIVTGSDFERRYDDGLVYDEHITPLLLAAYAAGLQAKLGLAAVTNNPFLNGLRTTVCQPYCHPARAHKLQQMMIDDDEWDAVREVITRSRHEVVA